MTGVALISVLAGGLGLFLLGLWLGTDGLKIAGGNLLKANLRGWTRDRLRAFLAGLLIALLVPSSGALTFAAIGFVNCGLVGLATGLWLMVGCSIGSVITSWLVVAVDSSPDLYPLALAYVGIGVLLRWTGPTTSRGPWGQALVGLGALLLGLQVLGTGFAELDPNFRLDGFASGLPGRAFLFVAIGAAFSTLVRSASATIAFALLAASAGALELPSAAALLVGANLGATAPALLALRDGTADARRMAGAHVAFHVLTTAVGIVTLMISLPAFIDRPGAFASPVLRLTLFHTMFASLGALVFYPLSAPLTHWLQNRFVAEESDATRPANLDANVLTIPDLALEGLVQEVRRISATTTHVATLVLNGERVSEFREKRGFERVRSLAQAVDDYVLELNRLQLPAHVADTLLEIPRASQAFRTIWDQLAALRVAEVDQATAHDSALRMRVRQVRMALLHLLEGCDPVRADFSLPQCHEERRHIELRVTDLERRLLKDHAGVGSALGRLELLLGHLRRIERMSQTAVEAATCLARARIAGTAAERQERAPAFAGASALAG